VLKPPGTIPATFDRSVFYAHRSRPLTGHSALRTPLRRQPLDGSLVVCLSACCAAALGISICAAGGEPDQTCALLIRAAAGCGLFACQTWLAMRFLSLRRTGARPLPEAPSNGAPAAVCDHQQDRPWRVVG
jgi:hypothetical protein